MTKLKEGDPAPKFSGIIEDGSQVSLADFQGKKLVIYFYPKDDTPGCTAEACNLRDNYQFMANKGYEILGVSPDGPARHQKFIAKYNLPFHLLADEDKTVLKAYDAWGLKKMYGREYEGVLRSTFIIDEKGNIEKIIRKVKTKDHANQILEN